MFVYNICRSGENKIFAVSWFLSFGGKLGDKRDQRRAANWISGWLFDFSSLHGEMNLKHMWFTLTKNSFNNWDNISRELKWLSLGHLVFSGHFFALLTHFYSQLQLQKLQRGEKCTWCVTKKRSFGRSHDNSLMSRFLPPSEPLEPVHLRKYVSKRKPEKLFKKWCIIYLCFFSCWQPVERRSCARRVLNLSDRSSHALALATCLFSMKSTLFLHTASCSESQGSLQNLYRAL